MHKLMDLIDDYLFVPLDIITYAERSIKQRHYRDQGVKFSILKINRGGQHTQNDVKRILDKYHVTHFGWKPDSRCIHFMLKRKQASWGEYLLLLAGVDLQNPLFN
ncbi:MAG: hypothetical protein KDE50_38570, partial [Caldilineaceae bacterium]|nr:hypothetical protein [Caldilineaceae bacterium]